MAYVSQEKKAKIAAAVKALNLGKEWKITLRVEHHSKICATIARAPESVKADYIMPESGVELYVNHYHLERSWKGETLKVLNGIKDALNIDNHDRSDSQTDYFDVGHYVSIGFGKWNKPCEFVG